MPLHFLSDNDVRILQGVIDAVKGGRINTPSRPPHERSFSDREDHQAPETYIALPQSEDGIPGLVATTGTGSDDYDIAGVGLCDIYRIIINDDDKPEIHPVDSLEKEVYNIERNPVSQQWTAVTRTKFGKWIPVTNSVRMIHGTVLGNELGGTGGFDTTDSIFYIDDIVAIYGRKPLETAEDTGTANDLLVHNVHHFSAEEGSRATVVFCEEEERWECIQVDCMTS